MIQYRNRKVGPGDPIYLTLDGKETTDPEKAHLVDNAVRSALHCIDVSDHPADWCFEPVENGIPVAPSDVGPGTP